MVAFLIYCGIDIFNVFTNTKEEMVKRDLKKTKNTTVDFIWVSLCNMVVVNYFLKSGINNDV